MKAQAAALAAAALASPPGAQQPAKRAKVAPSPERSPAPGKQCLRREGCSGISTRHTAACQTKVAPSASRGRSLAALHQALGALRSRWAQYCVSHMSAMAVLQEGHAKVMRDISAAGIWSCNAQQHQVL